MFKRLLDRKIVNDPKLQYGIAGFFVVLGLINFMFFVIVLKIFESKLYTEINALDSETSKYMIAVLKEISSLVIYTTSVFGVFILSFSFLGGILLLQHISGPIFALKKFMTEFLEGNKPRYPLSLRKYDFFNDLADLTNKLYEKYELKGKDKKD
jgi:hypothetical protein